MSHPESLYRIPEFHPDQDHDASSALASDGLSLQSNTRVREQTKNSTGISYKATVKRT